MSRVGSIVAVLAITLVNLVLVGCSSIFAVGGDGSAQGIYLVLGAGSLWVCAFATRALILASKGMHSEAVSCISKALPYGLLALILLQALAVAIR
jgi:hypothetical protein